MCCCNHFNLNKGYLEDNHVLGRVAMVGSCSGDHLVYGDNEVDSVTTTTQVLPLRASTTQSGIDQQITFPLLVGRQSQIDGLRL